MLFRSVYVAEAGTDLKVMVMFKEGFEATNTINYSLPRNCHKTTSMNVKDLLMSEATRHGMTNLDASRSVTDIMALIDDYVKTDWTARIADAKKYKVNLNGQYFKEDVEKMIAAAKSGTKS